MSARGMLSRLRKIEINNTSFVLRKIGSMERFEKNIRADIDAGLVCPHDGPHIIECVRSWVTNGQTVRMGNGVIESFTRTDT